MSTYTWKDAGQTIKGTGRSMTVERKGIVKPYSAIGDFINNAIGGVISQGNVALIIPPMYHPQFPWLRVSAYDIEDFEVPQRDDSHPEGAAGLIYYSPGPKDITNNNSLAGSGQVRATLTYTLPTLDKLTHDTQGQSPNEVMNLCDESYEFSSRMLTQQNQYYMWEDGSALPQKDEFLIHKSFTQVEARIVRKAVLTIPWNTISRLSDKVNKSTFRLLGTPFPPETIRFSGLSAHREITSSAGLKFYEVTYKFMIQPTFDYVWDAALTSAVPDYVGWNRFYDNEHQGWRRVVDRVTSLIFDRPFYLYDEDFSVVGAAPNQFKGLINLFNPQAV